MKQELAIAMALAIAGIGVGLAPVPQVAAGPGDCPEPADFDIPASEQTNPRTLLPDDAEIGKVTITSADGDRTLNVRLKTADDVLEWTVFHMDGASCVEYDDGNCVLDTSFPNVIDTDEELQQCTLEAPASGSLDYWVHYMNAESLPSGDSLDYTTWVP